MIIIVLFINIPNIKNIKNGVYNLMLNNLNLLYNKRRLFLSESFKYPNAFFRISKVYKSKNESYYNIEEIYTKYKLSYFKNKELFFNKNNDDFEIWRIVKLKENNFIIKNKQSNCSIFFNDYKFICDNIPIYKITKFRIIKIYSEVNKENNYKYELLNKEPIDIVIKYIDLKDPSLKRKGIHQIDKDYDNEELRYSIRSIINYIPWVRKIFILMPNEKVRYFKNNKSIKEKLVYIKDKDILGYDSSNSLAFQYRLWKMKKFGISDNIIVMDDDYFIGNKLNKSSFFYVNKGKVLPSIITSNFLKIDRKSVEENCHLFEIKAKKSKEEQNNDIFNYSKYLTFLFILDLFNTSYNDSIFIPKFTHNAIPLRLQDLKEIYDLINKSKYKQSTLESLYRTIDNLQFQTLVLSYTYIKYKRKVNNIDYKFIFLNDSISANYKFSLFCLNKGPGFYNNINYFKAKITMEYLFPNPSPFEIIDYSLINLSFNVAYYMEEEIKDYKTKYTKIIKKIEFYKLVTIFVIFTFMIFIKYNNINYTNEY